MKIRWMILGVFLLIPIAVLLIMHLHARMAFDRRVEQLADEGYPVSLAQLQQAYVLPDGAANAADVYIEAFSHYREPNAFEKQYLPIRGAYEMPDGQQSLPPEVMAAMESSLSKNRRTLELLDEAAGMEYCRWPRQREISILTNPCLSDIKEIAQLLCERNICMAQKRQAETLFKRIPVLLQLPEDLQGQANLIDAVVALGLKAMIVRNLETLLNQVEFSETQLDYLQKQFHGLQDLFAYYRAIISDRASAIEYINTPFRQRRVNGTDADVKKADSEGTHALKMIFYYTGLEKLEGVMMLDYLQRCIDACQLPLGERQAAFKTINHKLDKEFTWQLYLGEVYLYKEIAEIDMRVIGTLRCAETALAVERYRLRYGELPESLDVLVPEFMAAVPLEPFDGKPLRYVRHADGGYTIYTIGEDGVDNGGLSREQMEEEAGENNPDEYDWPFTVKR